MDVLPRIERICAAGLPDRPLRTRLLEAIATAIRYDAHVFALTDPSTEVHGSPHADVPQSVMAALPVVVRGRYAVHGAPAWRALLAPYGIVDTLLVTLEDRYGAWGWLELWRLDEPFAERDRATLGALAPTLTRCLRAAAARTFVEPNEYLPAIAPGVVVLDGELRVRGQTDAATEALLRLLPPDEDVPPVPAAAYNAGAALLAVEQGVRRGEPSARVHLGGNRWVCVRAARLGDDIAVSIAPATAAQRTDLFARSHGLSPREREVLALAVHGMDSRTIAGALVIAPTTAEDHLKALLAKTGAPSRQVLIARALGA